MRAPFALEPLERVWLIIQQSLTRLGQQMSRERGLACSLVVQTTIQRSLQWSCQISAVTALH